MIDVSEYAQNLSPMQEIGLREHLSKAYELAEKLEWCNPDSNLQVHKRTMSEKDGKRNKNAIVPIISATFDEHENAQNAYTELQRATNDINVDVYDVHYDKEDQAIGVVLDPFDI